MEPNDFSNKKILFLRINRRKQFKWTSLRSVLRENQQKRIPVRYKDREVVVGLVEAAYFVKKLI